MASRRHVLHMVAEQVLKLEGVAETLFQEHFIALSEFFDMCEQAPLEPQFNLMPPALADLVHAASAMLNDMKKVDTDSFGDYVLLTKQLGETYKTMLVHLSEMGRTRRGCLWQILADIGMMRYALDFRFM
jgi:hypothetical protein